MDIFIDQFDLLVGFKGAGAFTKTIADFGKSN